MSDLTALHRRLQGVLLLALPLACTAGDGDTKQTDSPKAQRKSDADKPDVNKPDTTAADTGPTTVNPVDNPPPPELMEMPSCPTGNWCGPVALAEPLRAKIENGPPDVGKCPGQIGGNQEMDAAAYEKYGDLPTNGALWASIDEASTKARHEAGDAETCCYAWTELCPGGRPLLDGSTPVLAPLRELEAAGRTDVPVAIAEAWLHDARMEHASIASFLRAAVELELAGGPGELVEAHRRAAEDERRHAATCFEIAARLGRACEPIALPSRGPRAGGLETVAVWTFIEGCVGETIAAACALRAARRCCDPEIAAALRVIADDEAEHAALAWRTVAWALSQDPRLLARLRAAAVELRPGDADAGDDELELDAELQRSYGRLDRRTRAALRREVWATIIDPLLDELGEAPRVSEPALS